MHEFKGNHINSFFYVAHFMVIRIGEMCSDAHTQMSITFSVNFYVETE